MIRENHPGMHGWLRHEGEKFTEVADSGFVVGKNERTWLTERLVLRSPRITSGSYQELGHEVSERRT